MKYAKFIGVAALILIGVAGWIGPASAATWRYVGPPGGGGPCGNTGGGNMACDGFICMPFNGVTCSSTVAYSIPPGSILCYCTDTAAGC